QRLVEIPQGVFALAIGSAALPTLSELKSQGKIDEAKGVFRYGLRLSLFVAIPASVALLVLAEPSVSVILGRGAFDAESVAQTARSLVWLAAGVWAVASIRTIVPMFHALGDTRTPVIASALNLVVFFSVGLGTMGALQHEGLALAISAAAYVQLTALLLLLRRKVGALGLKVVAASALRATLAASVMGGALWLGASLVDWSGSFRIPAFIGLVVGGAALYFGGATLLRSPEIRELWASIRRRR
ncbi:MAG: lipid II flippase MurJ, partial [Myxococcota bacterium]